MDAADLEILLKEYVENASDLIGVYEDVLLQLEQWTGAVPDEAMIGEVMGTLHTLKGNSGMMGIDSLQTYVHHLEDVFRALQDRAIPWDEEVCDLCLQSANVLRDAVALVAGGDVEGVALDRDTEHLVQQLAAAHERALDEDPASALDASPVDDAPQRAEPKAHFEQRTNVLKVDFERLDHLMNLMGELVIHRTRLGQIESDVQALLGERRLSQDLTDTSEQIGKVVTELHEAIMKVRMVPIRQVLQRFPRLARDLARESGKDVQIEFEGEETELDKTVIDEIGEPLLHLVRNAIDHGIEPPEQRRQLGKPERGTVCVRAYQVSSHIVIEVEDDGRGISEQRLRATAAEAGLLSAEELEQLEVLNLIFLPKRSLAKINGTISVQSELGAGTRFTIKLPLTLAIISALMVKVQQEQYAIPLSAVVESMKVDPAAIHQINHREVVQVRGRALPLIRLSDLFHLDPPPEGQRIPVVMVQTAGGEMGIVVDTLLGQQEIVIKALDDYLGSARGISGATILGDGKVVLIVDVQALMELAHAPGRRVSGVEESRARESGR